MNRRVTTRIAMRGRTFLTVAALSVVMIMSVTLTVWPPTDAYAQDVTVESIALEETVIMVVTNNADVDISVLRVWPEPDFNFQSFKTESGWTGVKNSVGVIIFTTAEPIKPTESVKFGLKVDSPMQSINWKALDSQSNTIDIKRSIITQLPTTAGNGVSNDTNSDPVIEDPVIEDPVQEVQLGITNESAFRIVPERPSIGSHIRVTGEKFGASQQFNFYIDSELIGSFGTNEKGSFITTMKIPEDQGGDRTEFTVTDQDGREKSLSIRIVDIPDRIAKSSDIPLTISGVPGTTNRGDSLNIFGTGDPNSAVTAIITTPSGEIINSRTAEIDSKGDWRLDEPIIVPLDSEFGPYTATITDGRESKLIKWTVESDKEILIQPTAIRFEPGETITFNGTAAPNSSVEFVLEDSLGKEVGSKILQTNNTGAIQVEFVTAQSIIEGTYTLIATQDRHKEFAYVGIGELPITPIRFEFDKLNYKQGDTATITLSGKGSDTIELVIIDPADEQKGNSTSITLQADGRAVHSIKLSGYTSGVYTAVISKGAVQSKEDFTVGLKILLGEIDIKTTKTSYDKGESILILGDAEGPNALFTISMINPAGETVRTRDAFTDEEGNISDDSFRIPSDAEIGEWTINAKGVTSFDNEKIQVVADAADGIAVEVRENDVSTSHTQLINIHVFGAKDKIRMQIIAADGSEIAPLEGVENNEGELYQPWIVPQDVVPGTYTIKVTDGYTSAETTFEIR